MTFKQGPSRIAVLDDYQNVALSMADWSALDPRATVTVFNDYLAEADAIVARLQPFDIVVEADLVAALEEGKIAGAAIDVFDQEPLPPDHPFRSLPNLLATPHIGYVSRALYERFYQDTVQNVLRWLDSQAGR